MACYLLESDLRLDIRQVQLVNVSCISFQSYLDESSLDFIEFFQKQNLLLVEVNLFFLNLGIF